MALVVKKFPKLFRNNSKQKGDNNLTVLNVIKVSVAAYKYFIAQATFRTLKYGNLYLCYCAYFDGTKK